MANEGDWVTDIYIAFNPNLTYRPAKLPGREPLFKKALSPNR
jgi:hypothetical protein